MVSLVEYLESNLVLQEVLEDVLEDKADRQGLGFHLLVENQFPRSELHHEIEQQQMYLRKSKQKANDDDTNMCHYISLIYYKI